MAKKFESLLNRILLVEEIERLTERKSIQGVSPVSVIQELRFVSSFVIRKGSVYALGFDENEEQWVVIGTFDSDEGVAAMRKANQWIQQNYDDAQEIDVENVEIGTDNR